MTQLTDLKPKDRAEAIALYRCEIIGAVARRELKHGQLRDALLQLSNNDSFTRSSRLRAAIQFRRCSDGSMLSGEGALQAWFPVAVRTRAAGGS